MIDYATFDGDVPALPQWSGPPRTTIHAQSLLYAGLPAFSDAREARPDRTGREHFSITIPSGDSITTRRRVHIMVLRIDGGVGWGE